MNLPWRQPIFATDVRHGKQSLRLFASTFKRWKFSTLKKAHLIPLPPRRSKRDFGPVQNCITFSFLSSLLVLKFVIMCGGILIKVLIYVFWLLLKFCFSFLISRRTNWMDWRRKRNILSGLKVIVKFLHHRFATFFSWLDNFYLFFSKNCLIYLK